MGKKKATTSQMGRPPHKEMTIEEVRLLVERTRDAIAQLEQSCSATVFANKVCSVKVSKRDAALLVPIHLRNLSNEIDEAVIKGEIRYYEKTPDGIRSTTAKPAG